MTWNECVHQTQEALTADVYHWRLRGCIGTFTPRPIAEGLEIYTEQSAFGDRRFAPISADEVPNLQCCVSFLIEFEDCDGYLDWEVGVHGIYIYMDNPARGPANATKRGTEKSDDILTVTFLPEVALQQQWTKIQTIDHAILKAGWHGPITQAMRDGLRLQRYKSRKMSVTYAEYKAWRQSEGA